MKRLRKGISQIINVLKLGTLDNQMYKGERNV